MVRTRQALYVFTMGMMLLIVSGLSSCGPSGSKQAAVPKVTKPVEEKEAELPVVYSKTVIAKNRLIRPYWLEIKMIPESQVPVEEGYFDKVEDVVGMMAKDDIPQGVGILKKMVTPSDVDRLRKVISKGMVAIAIPMTAVQAMPFLAPNDRVDVIGTLLLPDLDGRHTKAVTRFLARSVRVVAVHRTFDPGPYARKSQDPKEAKKAAKDENIRNPYQGREEIRSVTVEVPPKLAQELAMAMDMCKKIRLATCSESGTQLLDRDVRIDSSWLNASTEAAEVKKVATKEKKVFRELLVNLGNKHEMRRAWSNKALAEPYDEDGDAPLEQDGIPTGVKDRATVIARPPEDSELLEPLDDVDDSTISLPSLPDGVELPKLPE